VNLRRLRTGLHNRLFMQRVRWRTWLAERRYRLSGILGTRGMDCEPGSPLGVCLLTGNRDTLMALWALKSLLRFSTAEGWDVCIVSDGGLDAAHRQLLESHLRGVRVAGSEEHDKAIDAKLSGYPLTRQLRREFVLARKLIDPCFVMPSRRYLVLDSDVLFFGAPMELIERLRDGADGKNYFCRQEGCEATFTEEEGKRIVGKAVMPDCNSGVGVIEKESIDLETIERALEETEVLRRWRHVLEQSLYALLSTRQGFGFFPPTYQVDMGGGLPPRETVCSHYVATARYRFYSAGIRWLEEEGFLREWSGDSGGRDGKV